MASRTEGEQLAYEEGERRAWNIATPEWQAFLVSFKDEARQQLLNQLRDRIERIDRKEHICRFNDGKQNCDCYFEALDQVDKILSDELSK